MSLRDIDKNTMILTMKRFADNRSAFTEDKEQCRKVLAADIEAFLKDGGEITRVSEYESGYPQKMQKYSLVPKDYKDAKI